MIKGYATPQGTASYAARHAPLTYGDVGRTGLPLSQAGFGCYRVEVSVEQFYEKIKVPSSSFLLFNSKQEIISAFESGTLTIPFVQKLRRGGYDGRGVSIIYSQDDLNNLLEGASVVEELINIDKEISAIVARNERGEVKCHPTEEMEFNPTANLVEKLICPSTLPEEIETTAEDIAIKIITELDLYGLLAVEMFVDKNKKIWVNEIAPRPHNSGHHTIESAITSQFEQLLRAIFNFHLAVQN